MAFLTYVLPRITPRVAQYGVAEYATHSSSTNVWVGGYFGLTATDDWERQWTGAAWQNRDTTFTGISAAGGFDLWAGGTSQVWYHSGRDIWQYTGSAWQRDVALTTGSGGFFAGSGASDLYCLLNGTQSGIGVVRSYYWDGAAWSGPNTAPVNWPFATSYNVHARPAAMTPDGTLYAGLDLRARVAIDNESIVAYLDSGTWQPGLVLDSDRVIWTLWAADNSNVFVISQYTSGGAEEYFLWQGSGTSWTTVPVPATPSGHLYRWYGVNGVSADDYWLVGENVLLADSSSTGIAAHYTTGTWALSSFVPDAGGTICIGAAVTAVAADDVWLAVTSSSAAFGHVPTAYHWNGSSWTERSPFA